jgi:ABC-type hemin transport system substrate-binding protein
MADILILANSTKNRGFCIAGKDIAANRRIRLAGGQNGSELNLNQMRLFQN